MSGVEDQAKQTDQSDPNSDGWHGTGFCQYYVYKSHSVINGFFSVHGVNTIFALLSINALFAAFSTNSAFSVLSVVSNY